MTASTRLGATGPVIGPLGLGCMGMSWGYAEGSRDDPGSMLVIEQALDAGVTLLDTSDVYGDGHNERLLAQALQRRRDDAVVASKGGLVVDDLRTRAMHRDGSPAHLRRAVEASLRRLGTDALDLYYLHRVDDAVPLLDSWGALAAMVEAGLLRRIGLSEVAVAQAAAAHAMHPVAAIQSELSLWTRGPLADTLEWCAAHDATFVAFAPLGRGFLSGRIAAPDFEDGDFRATNPRFAPAALQANQRIVDTLRRVAARHNAQPGQVALAWVLAQGPHVTAIPGTRDRAHLVENLAAARIRLTSEDLADLDGAPAAVGERY